MLGSSWPVAEEFYQFGTAVWDASKPTEQISQVGRLHIPMAFSRDRVHVLLSLDTEKTDLAGLGPEVVKGGDYPQAWSRTFGKGRSFYTTLGHRDDIWSARRHLPRARHRRNQMGAAARGLATKPQKPRKSTTSQLSTRSSRKSCRRSRDRFWCLPDIELQRPRRSMSVRPREPIDDPRMARITRIARRSCRPAARRSRAEMRSGLWKHEPSTTLGSCSRSPPLISTGRFAAGAERIEPAQKLHARRDRE